MINAENLRDAEQRRFAWRCRRGLLELDIVLQDFVSKQFDSLNMNELAFFDQLLELPDNEFWDLINSPKVLEPEALKEGKTVQAEVANAMLEKLRSVRPHYAQL